jgi:disulfide bond formation protein DsbB
MAQPPGAVAECGASLDYMMDVLPMHEVLAKVLTGSGECAKLDWQFLGLNMPTWVLMALVAVGTWGLAVNWFGKRSG